jgi:hypothetical protein
MSWYKKARLLFYLPGILYNAVYFYSFNWFHEDKIAFRSCWYIATRMASNKKMFRKES